LEVKIPLCWTSIMMLLEHFPCLITFRAHIYRLHSQTVNITSQIMSNPIFPRTLRTLDLIGYFVRMIPIIDLICLFPTNLVSCRLMSSSVTQDRLTDILHLKQYFIGRRLFQSCPYLKRVRIHWLLSLDNHIDMDINSLRTLLYAFNDDPFNRQYRFAFEHRSISNGYVTLTCNYNRLRQ
jgi:hypothetical protein